MFYFVLARVLAILALIIAVLSVGMGSAALFGSEGDAAQFVKRYGTSPGAMLDRGIYLFVAAAVLGALSEIGFAVRRLAERRGE